MEASEEREFPNLVDEFLSKPRTNGEIQNYIISIRRAITLEAARLQHDGHKDFRMQSINKAKETYGEYWENRLKRAMTPVTGTLTKN